MDQSRVTSEMMSEAYKRASRYAPLPEWRPVTGGIAGAAVFCVPMIIFASAADGVSLPALVLNAAVGFALPFFYLKRQKDAHDRAWNNELEALKNRERDALQGTSDTETPTSGAPPPWLADPR
jgi:hypothetical protein